MNVDRTQAVRRFVQENGLPQQVDEIYVSIIKPIPLRAIAFAADAIISQRADVNR
jgi:hypothetical protein